MKQLADIHADHTPKGENLRFAYTRLIEWSGPALVSTTFLVLSLWSWRKWPDILVDFGRELYIPWQLAAGKVLYSDIAYFNGPFSPYLNSIWFRLFGVSLTTLIFVNLAIIATLTWMMYRLFSDACDRFTGTMVSLVFICVFAFSQYDYIGNYNFVCPYSHELTHGIGLTVAMIYILSRYEMGRQRPMILFAGFLLGLVFLTKAEVFLPAAAAAAVGVGLPLVSEKNRWRQTGLASFSLVGGALLPIAFFLVFLSLQMPAAQALRGIGGTWTALLSSNVASDPFYRHSMGIDHPDTNLATMSRTFCGFVLLTGALALTDMARIFQKRRGIILATCVLLLGTAVLVKQSFMPWLLDGRPLPLITMGTGAAIVGGYIRWRADQSVIARLVPLVMWVVFAFALLGKIILYPRLSQYGFALAMPATLLVVVCVVWIVPDVLARLYGRGQWFRRFAVAMLVADTLFYLVASNTFYSHKNYLVGANGDDILTYGAHTDVKGVAMVQALQRIQSMIAPDASFVVLPEGVMLNYLSRRLNPTPYVNFMPPELAIYGEAGIVDSFEAHPPDFVLLVQKDTSEYGVGYFGADSTYGRKIMGWVNSHYVTVDRILDEPLKDGRFGIEIRKRQK